MKTPVRYAIFFAALGFAVPILVTGAAIVTFGMPEGAGAQAFWLMARILCPFWSTASWSAIVMMQLTNTVLYAVIGWGLGSIVTMGANRNR